MTTAEKVDFGRFWEFRFEEKDYDEHRCSLCSKEFEKGDSVFLCEVCKKMFHVSCVSDSFGNIVASLFPCMHWTRFEYEYMRGLVLEE